MKSQGNSAYRIGFDVDLDEFASTAEVISQWSAPGLSFSVLSVAAPCPFCGRAPALQTEVEGDLHLIYCADPRHTSGICEEPLPFQEALQRWHEWTALAHCSPRRVLPFPRAKEGSMREPLR